MGRGRVGILLVTAALAFAACAPKSLTPDGGSGNTGTGGMYVCAHGPIVTGCSPGVLVTSNPPSDGSPCSVEGSRCEGTRCMDSHGEGPWSATCCGGRWQWYYDGSCPSAGGGGTGGVGGGSGTGGEGTDGGIGGVTGCDTSMVHSTCPGGIGPLGAGGSSASCDVEGATCQGYSCHDSSSGYDWRLACCSGRWWPALSCPPRLQPGEPFSCGFGGNLSCAAGQSYCSITIYSQSVGTSISCQPVCAAGDCSCFCDDPNGCAFKPPGSSCAADMCQCGMATTAGGVPIPGSVVVTCTLLRPDAGACGGDASVGAP